MSRWLALFLFLGLTGTGRAQTDYTVYRFHFVRAGLPVPEYDFLIGDAAQQYTTQGAGSTPRMTQGDEAGKTVQTLQVSPAIRDRIVRLFGETHGLTGCASKAKGIANTGIKTLSYHLAYKGDTFSCTYNYSESKPVIELTEIFQGMAVTLDAGRELQREERFDRLGLDAEMTNLVGAVKDGHALGLGNIAPVLQGLADDQQVLERVRAAARKLLEMAAAGK